MRIISLFTHPFIQHKNKYFFVRSISILSLLAVATPTLANNIFVIDLKKGKTVQVTHFAPPCSDQENAADTYNPTLSPDGKNVVAEYYPGCYTESYCAVTNIKTGVTTQLAGTLGCNNAAWSPNGEFIAYDTSTNGTETIGNIYVVPANGGISTLVRSLGVNARWSQDSNKLVFTDATDRNMGTVNTINLTTKQETIVAEAFNPTGVTSDWSGDGKTIVFNRTLPNYSADNLFTVPVDHEGNVTGPEVQVTFDPDGSSIYNQNPSFSNDNKTIAYGSNIGSTDFNFQIFSIPATGGDFMHVGGFPQGGNYNPAYSKNGQYIVWSGPNQ